MIEVDGSGSKASGRSKEHDRIVADAAKENAAECLGRKTDVLAVLIDDRLQAVAATGPGGSGGTLRSGQTREAAWTRGPCDAGRSCGTLRSGRSRGTLRSGRSCETLRSGLSCGTFRSGRSGGRQVDAPRHHHHAGRARLAGEQTQFAGFQIEAHAGLIGIARVRPSQ